jgi:hypothetical protein
VGNAVVTCFKRVVMVLQVRFLVCASITAFDESEIHL